MTWRPLELTSKEAASCRLSSKRLRPRPSWSANKEQEVIHLGAALGGEFLALATDLAAMAAGLLAFMTVVGGIQLFTDIGGPGVGHFVRSYMKGAILGALFCGSFAII